MYEDICYEKNYISEVICRLDFADKIVLFDRSMPKSVYNVVKRYYPIVEPQDVIGTQLQVNSVTGPVVNNTVSKQWIFWASDKMSCCSIDSTCIVFSVKNYDVFEHLRNVIISIMKAVLSLDENYQGRRFGLRYINMLPMKFRENWIAEDVSSAIIAHKDDRTIRLITQLEYAVDEKELHVKLQYGYPNPDYPAVMKNELFTIDIDAYYQGLIYDDDLEQMIDNMHAEDQLCFEKMITDELRSVLGCRGATNVRI